MSSIYLHLAHICLHPSTCKDTRACQVLRVWLQASPDNTPSPPAPTPPAPTSATPTPTGLSTLPKPLLPGMMMPRRPSFLEARRSLDRLDCTLRTHDLHALMASLTRVSAPENPGDDGVVAVSPLFAANPSPLMVLTPIPLNSCRRPWR